MKQDNQYYVNSLLVLKNLTRARKAACLNCCSFFVLLLNKYNINSAKAN